MSSRLFPKFRPLPALSALIVGLGICGAAFAAGQVQTYADQAMPVAPPTSEQYYDSPLAAGTLTLQDVLEAHQPQTAAAPSLPSIAAPTAPTATAPLLSPSTQQSSTSLMMSQGMKAVLQKVGEGTPVNSIKPPVGPPAVAQGAPAPLVSTAAVPIVAPADAPNPDGLTYQPGQQPKNLATAISPAPVTADVAAPQDVTAVPVVAPVADQTVSTPAETPTDASSSTDSCGKKVQKWEKTCAEAGYPATYMGKIVGETRTGCTDGMLHDVWVTNSCAPQDSGNAQTVRTDGACGPASNNEYDKAPVSNLCLQGIASEVSGEGPWTWACSGINGGAAAACTAAKIVPLTNGACGAANGVAVTSVPSDDLCNAGTASAVKGSGPWTWSCKGNGKGRVESCIAPVLGGAASVAPVSAPTPAEETVSSASAAAAVAATPAGSEKGELCGPAAETLAYEAPDKDLCRAGMPGSVSGSGPWTWVCTDNSGTTSSCRTLSLSGAPETPAADAPAAAVAAASESPAPEQPVPLVLRVHNHSAAPASAPELACGIASTQPASQKPSSDLCEGGKASAVKGSGPWHWTCSHGKQKLTCETMQSVDGSCGPANGSALKSAPFSGLCASGSPSSIEGGGPWNWVCNGSGGGANVSCAATVGDASGKIDGVCGTSDGANLNQAPTAGLCVSGTPSAVGGSGPWTWSCSGTNGGAVGSCAAGKIAAVKPPGPPVNGLCGLANGVTSASQPTDNLCASGILSTVVGNGPWNWTCAGQNGGMSVSCTAPLEPPAAIDGVCGGANGVPTLVKPQSGLCDAGITGTVNGKGPWTWTCSGANGGEPASCVAPVAGKSAAMPSTMTVTDGEGAESTAPSGLVTPRLPTPSDATIPSLDKKTLPSLSTFAVPPKGSKVPAAVSVTGDEAPEAAPSLPVGTKPVTPPAFGDKLPPAPALQEDAMQRAASIPGNHLELDPTISTILFERGEGNIAENVLSTLDRLSNVLNNNPDVRISLTAYADNEGSTPRDARRLSLTRAIAVRDYLASKGIAQSRVDIHAEGANTATGYIDRVDVKVID